MNVQEFRNEACVALFQLITILGTVTVMKTKRYNYS